MQKVSVVIPTWNRAHTIGAAIESVLAQTHAVHEVLVCDDGSTDNTPEIVAAINDERVRLITGPRAGRPAVPRNRGIKLAKGNWIAFLDSDDCWLPTKLETQFAAVKKDGTLASSTNAWQMLPGKGRVTQYLKLDNSQFTLRKLLETNYVICSSVLVQKQLVEECGSFPEADNLKAIEDYALWLRIASKTNISFCAEPLVEYLDDAVNSVRSSAKEPVQRENVMLDFYRWYSPHGKLSERNAARNAVRIAMKNNGRSFIERWKIK